MKDRATWLEERKSYIGASDIGALLLDSDGHPIHPYRTPHDVWLDKRGLKDFEETERTLMGQLLEPLIVRRFALANPGVRVRATGTHQGETSHHACNPDRLIVQRVSQIPGSDIVAPDRTGLKAILQLKSAGYFGAQDFGVAGTDEVPDWYLAQVQWEMYCTQTSLAVLGLLYDTHLYRQFVIYRDDELINVLKLVADDFWTRCILAGTPPPITGHKADKEYLDRAWTPKNDDLVIATQEIDAEVSKLSSELGHFDRLTNIIEGRKNRIKQFMGDKGRLATSLGEIAWRADKNGQRSLRLSQIKAASTTTEKAS